MGRWSPVTLRRSAVLAAAAASFAGLLFARGGGGDAAVADAVLLSFVVPIALLGFEFGVRGGVGAALAAIAIEGLWDALSPDGLTAAGYVSRALVFLVLGGGIGRFADVRKRLEGELLRARDMSLDMIATAGLDGMLLSVNSAWERVLGIPPATLLQRPFIDFVHPDDVAATIRATAEAREHDVVNFRNRYRRADGSYCWLEWSAHPQIGAGVIYASARDVTVQKQAEEVLAAHAEVLEREVLARTEDLDRARFESLRRLALAAEFRDDETHQHTERVGRCAAAIAGELGLPATAVAELLEAAPLHDVGKIGISDTILLKPGRLTPDELTEMRRHSEIGARILSGSDFAVLELAAEIALTHHERWDGSGYPAGLRSEEIPIAGRIVALADVFDALTHVRPYKGAWPRPEALAALREGSGTHFDPQVVAAFERLELAL